MTSKTLNETTAELITAALVGVVFVLFLLGDISSPLALMVGGVILLGSGWYQSQRGWHVNFSTWLLGLILLLGGLGVRVFLVAFIQINWVLIGIILVGGYILYQFVSRRLPKEKEKNA